MALIDLGPLVTELVGPIGGTTFGRSMAGRGARRRAGPPNADSAAELAARNTQVYVAKQWQLLTKTQQAQWNLAGRAHPLANRLRQYRTVPGFALWMQLGTNLVNAGQVLVPTPPTSWTTPPVIDPNVTPTLAPTATTGLSVSWNQQTPVDSVVVIKATGPTPWGKTPQRGQLRTIANIAPMTNVPIDVTTAWSNVYGLPPQSTPYQILWEFQPYQRSTGAQGPWIDFVQSTGGPNPTSPPAPGTNATGAPSITESLTYQYTGDTGAAEWLALTTTAGIDYTVVWNSANLTAAPILAAGPTPTSLTTIATFAAIDAATFRAKPGWTYYVGMDAWSIPTAWSVLYAPSQTLTYPVAHLTASWTRRWLIMEGTNLRLISDVQYQGP
jgi:hypothetical protein